MNRYIVKLINMLSTSFLCDGRYLALDNTETSPHLVRDLQVQENSLCPYNVRQGERRKTKISSRSDVAIILANHHINAIKQLDMISLKKHYDKRFYENIMLMFEHHYSDTNLSKTSACNIMAMSERTLSRKLLKISQLPFVSFLTKYRLRKAMQFLYEGHSVGDVADECGFSSISYFSKCFHKEYGFAPSILINELDKVSHNIKH